MGVSSIRDFAAPLMVGIVCGAYTSVCITGALWYVMKHVGKNKYVPSKAVQNKTKINKSSKNHKEKRRTGKVRRFQS